MTLCLLDGMCHGWSGRGFGGVGVCLPDYGAGPLFEDAAPLIWRFFEAQW